MPIDYTHPRRSKGGVPSAAPSIAASPAPARPSQHDARPAPISRPHPAPTSAPAQGVANSTPATAAADPKINYAHPRRGKRIDSSVMAAAEPPAPRQSAPSVLARPAVTRTPYEAPPARLPAVVAALW